MTRGERLPAALAVLLGVAAWWVPSHTVPVPPWPAQVAGFAYSPLRGDRDPRVGGSPGESDLAADLDLLADRTRAIRTYGLDGTLERIPALAAQRGLSVTVGVSAAGDEARFAGRLRALGRVIGESRNVPRVILGNEDVLTGRLSPAQLAARLDRARAALPVPVSTAEPWHVWLAHPGLARHVDFLTVHLLPYWEGVAVEDAVAYVDARVAELSAAFPGKPLLIGEVGWPSRGRNRGAARAGHEEQSRFLAEFLAHPVSSRHGYFLLEAFDQPWKRSREGAVGAHWGVYDASRDLKVATRGVLRTLPGWHWRGLLTGLLALALLRLLRRGGGELPLPGRFSLALAAWALAAGVVVIAHLQWEPYWSAWSAARAVLVALAVAGAAVLLLAEVHEWVEARWGRHRGWRPRAPAARRAPPMVSLHLPVCSEPPALVLETLSALAALDYPRLEVLVVDNNTPDPALWQPVRDACARLGGRFRFFHLPAVPGYKAGALNAALAGTHRDAEVVAVIDADYVVSPGWLRELVGHFEDPGVVVVQSPQDYRDGGGSPFKAACRAEYEGFFRIGMITRDARNAIIQHGTMTLVRRRALEDAGGWGEWTITEDAELGLRLLAAGGEARYVPAIQGRGLTPDRFLDYRRQRIRWVLGAVQVLRGHRRLWWPRCAGGTAGLSTAQRYHFVAGWLPWLADGVALVLAVGAAAWSLLMLASPARFDPPMTALSLVPVTLFTVRLVKQLHLYRTRVGAHWRASAAAALAGMALMPAAGLAVLLGIAGRRRAFLRTPKLARRHTVTGALAAAAPEAVMAVVLLVLCAATATLPQQADTIAWRWMLVVMSVPYLCALGLSLLSALPRARGASRRARAALPRPGSQEV